MGRIHSIESMGLFDGPGIRTVVFFQGCNLRCLYCHNPDTWNFHGGIEITPKELVEKIIRFKPYFERSGGGVTFSGGEPLMQPEFLYECLKLCKENGINTALDTSGYGCSNYEKILELVDTVLLDVKHFNPDGYFKISGGDFNKFIEFKNKLIESGKKVWIRSVIVPGINDNLDFINEVRKIGSSIPNVEKVEFLPYHTMGLEKYELLQIPYRLKDVLPMDKLELDKLLKD